MSILNVPVRAWVRLRDVSVAIAHVFDAASVRSGMNRRTHRYTLTWSTSMPRSASSSSTSRYDSAKGR
jgi:hypothetical protein